MPSAIAPVDSLAYNRHSYQHEAQAGDNNSITRLRFVLVWRCPFVLNNQYPLHSIVSEAFLLVPHPMDCLAETSC